jgi:hypothetical protein
MTLKTIAALAMITVTGLGGRAEAQPPCQEYLRLRNAATEAWKEAMRAPQAERCGALDRASSAAEATLNYVNSNRESCGISVHLLNQVEENHRKVAQAGDDVCAGRLMRPYPAEIIRHSDHKKLDPVRNN